MRLKRRIILRPCAIRRGEHWRAVIERYVEGVLIGVPEEAPHEFTTEASAEGYADATARGVIDELLRHYGDAFMFTICPATLACVAAPAPWWATGAVPGFLLREYRARNPAEVD